MYKPNCFWFKGPTWAWKF